MRYRKKPIVIEAVRIIPHGRTGLTPQPQPSWWVKAHSEDRIEYNNDYQGSGKPAYLIHTLEGTMAARQGDYVIQGVEGELYPCSAAIFAATYEVAIEEELSADNKDGKGQQDIFDIGGEG